MGGVNLPHFKVTYRDPAHPGRTVTLLTCGHDIGVAALRARKIEPKLETTRIVEFNRVTGSEGK